MISIYHDCSLRFNIPAIFRSTKALVGTIITFLMTFTSSLPTFSNGVVARFILTKVSFTLQQITANLWRKKKSCNYENGSQFHYHKFFYELFDETYHFPCRIVPHRTCRLHHMFLIGSNRAHNHNFCVYNTSDDQIYLLHCTNFHTLVYNLIQIKYQIHYGM